MELARCRQPALLLPRVLRNSVLHGAAEARYRGSYDDGGRHARTMMLAKPRHLRVTLAGRAAHGTVTTPGGTLAQYAREATPSQGDPGKQGGSRYADDAGWHTRTVCPRSHAISG